MRGLSGKIAIVTGGAGRIGRGVVARLVEEGVRTVVADINAADAQSVAAQYGEMAHAIAFDAADEGSVRALVDGAVDRFGGLDILHNNAAFVNLGELGVDTTALETPLALWDLTMNINVRSYFIASAQAIPHMIARGGGAIINTSSGSGHRGDGGVGGVAGSRSGQTFHGTVPRSRSCQHTYTVSTWDSWGSKKAP